MLIDPVRPKAISEVAPLLRTVAITVLMVIVVSGLYVGQSFLVPLSLAILLSFVLAKPVNLLQKLRLPRALSAILVVLTAFGIIFALGGLIASQINQLAADLPRYQSTIQTKVQSVKGLAAGSSALERAADILQNLSSELDRPSAAANPEGGKALGPMKVELLQPDPSALQSLRSLIAPLISPLATTGIIIIFVIFILVQKEDLRNRLIRLAGSHDLQRTTDALDDAANRLSRLFAAQLLVNSGFGLLIGIGLWAIGIPSPILWGILGGVLRFVPYIGSIIAAAFPLALAAAVDPGWSMLVYTAILFFIVEPAVAQLVEPLAFGRSTGLSPVSVVVSATFWTALWGPIGLILATPLTVCFVVLGRHVKALEFIDVMFGDRPALLPEQIFYQRMLADDPVEAADKAGQFLKKGTLATYYDEVALRGLRLAQDDFDRSTLSEDRALTIENAVKELTEDLPELDYGDEVKSAVPGPEVQATFDHVAQRMTEPLVVLAHAISPNAFTISAVAARTSLDQSVTHLFLDLCQKHGLQTSVLDRRVLSGSYEVDLDISGKVIVCISYLDMSKRAHMRLATRRVKRQLPNAMVVLGCWSAQLNKSELAEIQKETGSDCVVSSLTDAVAWCLSTARSSKNEN